MQRDPGKEEKRYKRMTIYIIHTILTGCFILAVGITISKAYRDGYDAGFEEGWKLREKFKGRPTGEAKTNEHGDI